MTQLSALPVTVKKISDPTSHTAVAGGVSLVKTSSGPVTVLPSVTHDRLVLGIVVEITEATATNTGTQPAFKIGDDDDDVRFIDNVALEDAAVGDVLRRGPFTGEDFDSAASCLLLAGKSIIATCTAALGDATGACKVVAITVAAP